MIRLVDPTTAPTPARFRPAPRRELAGARLGLLANGKLNADRLLLAVAERLQAEHGLAEVVAWTKPSAFQPAPPSLLEQLRQRADIALTGVGD